MSVAPITLQQAQDERWDVVVVGTGIGGASCGYALAERGHRVLFLEKGLFLFGAHDRGTGQMLQESSDPAERMRRGWWPVQLEGRTSYASSLKMFAPLGCGTGGSSSLYAAQMERLMPSDFEPKRHHPRATDATLPEAWPYDYAELAPYYRRAEALYEVCGTPDPLNPDPEARYAAPPAMSERDAFVFESMKSLGMHPYRAHVGCRYLPGCMNCGARLCPRACKTDAGRVALLPALERHGAAVLTEAEVLRLEAGADRVEGVVIRHQGAEATVRGKVVVLAAGSLMTPALLLRSTSAAWPTGLANRNDLVGRNLMMHTSDFIAVRPPKMLDPNGPAKALSANDLYARGGRKLGTFQSVGMPVNQGSIEAYLKGKSEKDPGSLLSLGGALGRKVASKVGAVLFQQANIFASIVEDLPYLHNRVVLDDRNPNGMRFEYTYPDELKERNALFRSEIERWLSPKMTTLLLGGDNNLNFGHVAGTARAGHDPKTSVVDAAQRAHEVENLYVADASVFPSSGGINPSLTIAATALRAADRIAARLGS
jgi:choline dehydrogenase-like flavoprotein